MSSWGTVFMCSKKGTEYIIEIIGGLTHSTHQSQDMQQDGLTHQLCRNLAKNCFRIWEVTLKLNYSSWLLNVCSVVLITSRTSKKIDPQAPFFISQIWWTLSSFISYNSAWLSSFVYEHLIIAFLLSIEFKQVHSSSTLLQVKTLICMTTGASSSLPVCLSKCFLFRCLS